jgi:hypothetical protein
MAFVYLSEKRENYHLELLLCLDFLKSAHQDFPTLTSVVHTHLSIPMHKLFFYSIHF